MQANSLEAALGRLWNSRIDGLSVSLLSHSITLELTYNPYQEAAQHTLTFEGVSSFYFINGIEEDLEETPWDWAELTAIDWASAAGSHYLSVRDLVHADGDQRHSSANFVLDIFSAALYVSAHAVVVDGQRFDVRDAEKSRGR